MQIVTTVTIGLFFVQQIKTMHTEQTYKTLSNIIPIVKGDVHNIGLSPTLNRRIKEQFETTKFRVTVIDTSGNVIADSESNPQKMDNHLMRKEVQDALRSGKSGSAQRYSQTIGEDMAYFAKPYLNEEKLIAVLRVAMPMSTIQKEIHAIVELIIVVGGILLFLTIATTLLISRIISANINQLVESAHRFASGELHHRIHNTHAGEFEELGVSLNAMAERLSKSVDSVEKTKEEQSTILRSMPTGVVALDGDKTILSFNAAATKILDVPDTVDPRGRQLEEFVRDVDLSAFIDQTTRARPQRFELVVLGRNGIGRELIAKVQQLIDNEEKVSGYLVLLDDVTALRRLEGIRSDFSANVSHELRTPITAIKGYVETLHDVYGKDEETQKCLEIIERNTVRLEKIIEDLLSLASLEQDNDAVQSTFETIALDDVITNVVSACGDEAKVTHTQLSIQTDYKTTISGNRQLLEQACVNLVQNAIRYGNGEVKIHTGLDGDLAVLSVSDNGQGIPRDLQNRLFERFFRVDKGRSRDSGGTGLGLAIVKHVALVHGGSISVSSGYGSGTTFELRIPIAP